MGISGKKYRGLLCHDVVLQRGGNCHSRRAFERFDPFDLNIFSLASRQKAV